MCVEWYSELREVIRLGYYLIDTQHFDGNDIIDLFENPQNYTKYWEEMNKEREGSNAQTEI